MRMPNTGLRILFGERYGTWSWKHDQLPYTTPTYIAKKVAELAEIAYCKNGTQELVIWDMFAGLGSDVINLARKGFMIYATEISPEIYNLLEQNIKNFKLEDRVQSIRGDCLQKFMGIEADVIYFDPPWGGSFNSDKEFDFSTVKLENGMGVVDLLRKIYTEKTKNIIIKAPLKSTTFEHLDFLNVYRIYIFRKHSLKFIFTR